MFYIVLLESDMRIEELADLLDEMADLLIDEERVAGFGDAASFCCRTNLESEEDYHDDRCPVPLARAAAQELRSYYPATLIGVDQEPGPMRTLEQTLEVIARIRDEHPTNPKSEAVKIVTEAKMKEGT